MSVMLPGTVAIDEPREKSSELIDRVCFGKYRPLILTGILAEATCFRCIRAKRRGGFNQSAGVTSGHDNASSRRPNLTRCDAVRVRSRNDGPACREVRRELTWHRHLRYPGELIHQQDVRGLDRVYEVGLPLRREKLNRRSQLLSEPHHLLSL